MAIELKDASFTYPNGYTAVEHLNLVIESGEKVGIVGQNGAGKTTAVKMMNGLHKPSGGDVIVDGVNTKEKTTAQISTYVGYVFQNPDDQIFNKSVIAEIEYMPRYLKMEEKEIKRRVERAVELTGIAKYLKKNPFDIPYSTRKFVAIAAILATETPYLILDEPTAGQDAEGIAILSHLIDALQAEGRSVITITHDMEFVADNFDRVVAMAQKHIIADGSARDIFWNEEVVSTSRIRKTAIGELAKELQIGERILYCDEMVEEIVRRLGR
ncbi:energy-coupling factor ABC transporter ATP-binding protein [Bittarella massiliensis (ex Durand et al. 2017)]|uniref:energy-coupling factor ABC transporter ATP-binding protein n=1 Tax=Bittarella massiliensis (ex Durand et al. 2017) TaxID=1720313 RepID=UPI00073EA608|nr:ABC transporter ATP-binding protein [Bittarella massiliensis (ex Durand et al. 2017)]